MYCIADIFMALIVFIRLPVKIYELAYINVKYARKSSSTPRGAGTRGGGGCLMDIFITSPLFYLKPCCHDNCKLPAVCSAELNRNIINHETSVTSYCEKLRAYGISSNQRALSFAHICDPSAGLCMRS